MSTDRGAMRDHLLPPYPAAYEGDSNAIKTYNVNVCVTIIRLQECRLRTLQMNSSAESSSETSAVLFAERWI